MSIEKFFNPSSVAIIGASHTQGKIGYIILENFVKGNYKGRVYPVNPDVTPILGREVFPSIKKIQDRVDLAVIAIPAEKVPKVLRECVEKKIKAVIIVSGGFSETGEKGRKLEEELKKIIKNSETRVIGTNSLGVLNTSTNVDTLFNPREKSSRPPPGSIGFISQSGAIGATILDWLAEEQTGISKFISYENAVDVNECDALEYFGNDEKTKVIALYFEGVKDGKRFIEVARKVSKKTPIIALKGGKTEAGKKAAISHTATIAGSAKVYSSVFKQTGIIEADNWEELFDFAKAFLQPLPKGRRIAIVTDGGGFGVLAADECEKQGLELPEPSGKLKKMFRKSFPEYAILSNPIDLTGNANAEMYRTALEECLKSKEFDAAIAITLFQVPALGEELIDVIADLKKYGKPILCCATGGKFTIRLARALEKNGIPVYVSPERAVKAMSVLVKYSNWIKK
ncbi:MAG: CoA-binding protein [Candidatus Aenigmarchaeota archaeon]|nr:CoA-binding protein [Candidatus Aenigmarchaeota archaeon]